MAGGINMTEDNRYSPLKRLGVLMALDTAGAVANIAIFLARTLWSTDSEEAALLADAVSQYTQWTVWALRLLAWALTLAALSSLSNVSKSFGRARLWYLLRILILAVTPMAAAAVNYRNLDAASLSLSDITLVAGALAFIAGMSLLGESLLSLGYRSVLFAAAELMHSFGLEDIATENRRCGNRLAVCVAAQTLAPFLVVALAVWVLVVQKIGLFDNPVAFLLFVLLIPIGLLAGFGMMAFRVWAAVRMRRTYRVVKELTE